MKEIIDFFGSVKTAIVIFVLIIIASIAATFFPQAIADKYVYKSFWFVSLLIFLIIGLIASVVKKWPFTKNRIPSVLTHSSMVFILIGVLLGLTMGQKGYIYLGEGKETDTLVKEGYHGIHLPFSVYLDDFVLEMNEVEALNRIKVISVHNKIVYEGEFSGPKVIDIPEYELKVEIIDVVPDFALGAGGDAISRSEMWNNPAIKLKVGKDEGWLFAKFPDFHGTQLWNGYRIRYENSLKGGGVKDYKSAIIIKEKGKEIVKKTIEVNDPLKYKGYIIYQYSYDEKNLTWTGLMVKKDPGVLVVYFGFVLLLAGLFAVLIKYASKQKS